MNLATHHLSAACYEIGRTIIFFLIIIFIFSLFDFPFSFLVSNIFQHTPTRTHTHPHAFSLTSLHPEKICETQLDYLVHSYTPAIANPHFRAAPPPPYPRHHLPGLSLFHRFYSFFHQFHSTRPYREDVSICVSVCLFFSPFFLFWHLFRATEEITCILQKKGHYNSRRYILRV